MKVEIWSDIMCPFCYIGKRKYEQALKEFAHADEIETVWRSYQLDPDIKPGSVETHDKYIGRLKGWSQDQTLVANSQVAKMAHSAGLDYHLEKALAVNTFDAHRLSHLAAKKGLANAAEEELFKAFFIDGKNVNDQATLVNIGKSIGLEESAIRDMLGSKSLADEVKKDFEEADIVEVDVVPFFLFNKKHILTGAQSSETFLEVLNTAYDEWKKNTTSETVKKNTTDGSSCSIDGTCS